MTVGRTAIGPWETHRIPNASPMKVLSWESREIVVEIAWEHRSTMEAQWAVRSHASRVAPRSTGGPGASFVHILAECGQTTGVRSTERKHVGQSNPEAFQASVGTYQRTPSLNITREHLAG